MCVLGMHFDTHLLAEHYRTLKGQLFLFVVWLVFFPGWKAFPDVEACVDKTEGFIFQVLALPVVKLRETTCPYAREECFVLYWLPSVQSTGAVLLCILILSNCSNQFHLTQFSLNFL